MTAKIQIKKQRTWHREKDKAFIGWKVDTSSVFPVIEVIQIFLLKESNSMTFSDYNHAKNHEWPSYWNLFYLRN